MGQRHQIVVILPKTETETKRAIAIHHQWLYGKQSVLLLKQFLNFIQNARTKEDIKENELPFCITYRDPNDVLKIAYSIDKTSGYYHQTHIISPDYECFDNNDGVTLIDYRNPNKPKYCFFAINDDGYEVIENTKPFEPNSANEYQRLYEIHNNDRIEINLDVLSKDELKDCLKICKETAKNDKND